jgi:hypothetical protein
MNEPTYRLDDAQAKNRAHPATYRVPPGDLIRALRPGSLVKLCFLFAEPEPDGCEGERMWVRLTRAGDAMRGELESQPSRPSLAHLRPGAEIEFDARHVLDAEA